MKVLLLLSLLFSYGCTSTEVVAPPLQITGKWLPTYLVQSKLADGQYGNWYVINTFAALPEYEFKSNGDFLRNGKLLSEECKSASNSFTIVNNTIVFKDFKASYPQPACPSCSSWQFEKIGSDTLIIDQCLSTRYKYVLGK